MLFIYLISSALSLEKIARRYGAKAKVQKEDFPLLFFFFLFHVTDF